MSTNNPIDNTALPNEYETWYDEIPVESADNVSQETFDAEKAARDIEDSAQDAAITAANDNADSRVLQTVFDAEQSARTAEDAAQDTAIAAADTNADTRVLRAGDTSTGAQLTTRTPTQILAGNGDEFITVDALAQYLANVSNVDGSYSGLIKNGSFALGNGTNFTNQSTFTKERAAKLNSGGSLGITTATAVSTQETVSVSPASTYKLSYDWLVDDFLTAPSCLVYVYTQFFDAQGAIIRNADVNIRPGTTGAELSQDINIGDTSISVVSHDWTIGNVYTNRIRLPYMVNGIDYDGTPYSRRSLGGTSEDLIDWANTTSTSIALKRAVVAGETALSGQTIWQGNNGGTYVYVQPQVKAADGQPLLSTDIFIGPASRVYAAAAGRVLNFSWDLDGVAPNTAPWQEGKMPPGTASVSIGCLPRHGSSVAFKTYLSNFNMFQTG